MSLNFGNLFADVGEIVESINLFAGGEVVGVHNGGAASANLVDTHVDFKRAGVKVGSVVTNLVNSETGEITAISTTSAGQVFTVTTGTDKVNITTHGFVNGDRIIFSSTAVLPAGLEEKVRYYVINKATNDFEVALTSAGTLIDITGTGTGTHTAYVWPQNNKLEMSLSGGESWDNNDRFTVSSFGEMIGRINTSEDEITASLGGNSMFGVLDGLDATIDGWRTTVLGWITSLISKSSVRLVDEITILDELDVPLTMGATAQNVLAALYRKMLADSEDINAGVVDLNGGVDLVTNVGRISTSDGNGTGILLLTNILDGATAPSSGWPVIPEYAYDMVNSKWPGDSSYVGKPSELAVAGETMTLTCSSDSAADGVAEGSETFDLTGGDAGSSLYDPTGEGTGSGTTINVMNGSGLITNGEFENFTDTNTPDDWTIVSPAAAGTDIFANSSEQYRGAACLEIRGAGTGQVFTTDFGVDEKLDITGHGYSNDDRIAITTTNALPGGLATGILYYVINKTDNDFELSLTSGGGAINITDDGTGTHTATKVIAPAIQISQDASTSLVPLKRYCVACWIKTSGAGIVAGDLTIQFEGTGYSAGANEKISMSMANLASQTTFTTDLIAVKKYFFVTMPAYIPADFELVIKTANALTSGEKIYIDGLSMGAVNYHGGIGFVILAGQNVTASPNFFLRGDRMTFTVGWTGAEGVFQQFFRKAYNMQLPSQTDGTETRKDTLATD